MQSKILLDEIADSIYEEQAFVSWRMKFSTEFLFEIESEQLKNKLPKRITAIEVRPGISLISVGTSEFYKGNAGYLEAFTELSLSVPVQPNFSLMGNFGVPMNAFYVIHVVANNKQFLDYTSRVDKIPVFRTKSLKIRLNPKQHGTTAEDAYGPIMECQNTHPNPRYEKRSIPCQVIGREGNEIYLSNIAVEGRIFEHQKQGDYGKLYNHPFFDGLDVASCKKCYMQYLSAPKTEAVMKWAKPVKMRI